MVGVYIFSFQVVFMEDDMKVRVKYNPALNDGFTIGQIDYRD
jgi:hypothetical protein